MFDPNLTGVRKKLIGPGKGVPCPHCWTTFSKYDWAKPEEARDRHIARFHGTIVADGTDAEGGQTE